jgi:type IV pilus assembly protein PilY1
MKSGKYSGHLPSPPEIYDRTSVSTTGTVTGTTTECLYDGSSNSFGMRTLVTSINPTSTAATDPTNGWYVSLTQGERVITRPMAVGGLVDFLTYKPSSDACAYGGDSYLYAVGYTTGVAPTNVAIRSPETTGGATTGTVTVARGVLLGPGAPPTGEAIIIPPPKEGQETLKKKIQIATGVIVEAENAPVHSTISKIVHWLKK